MGNSPRSISVLTSVWNGSASELEESEETAGTSTVNKNGAPPAPPEAGLIDALASDSGGQPSELGALDFSEDNEAAMLSHARRNAQIAAQVALDKAKKFDETYQSEQALSKENYILNDDMENGGDAAMEALVGKAAKEAQIGDIDRTEPYFMLVSFC